MKCNEYDYNYNTFFLLFSVPISPPLDITVSGVSSAAVLIKWLPPTQPNGIITSYTLYINFSNNSNVDVVIVDGRLSLYFINGLAMNQNVGVSIVATTVIGNGPQSMAVFNKTTGIETKQLLYYLYQ